MSLNLIQSASSFDVSKTRRDFPILARTVRDGKNLVYLDNAATTQKPRSVIAAMNRYYEEENANIHRGIHFLSETATKLYDTARDTVATFINAGHAHEVIFVRGTTEGINLVASAYGSAHVSTGDEIIVTEMEHHSNIVPWQLLCERVGARLRVIPMTDEGELRLDEFDRLLGPRTKLVAIVYVSNALGTVNPVKDIIERAHAQSVPVLIDAAQAAPHVAIDVRALDCDFLAFSGHKVYGPTGIGVLYGKERLLDAMEPYQAGGDMIRSVTFEKTTFNVLPFKFEAGTPNIQGVIGLGAAIDYISTVGLAAIAEHESRLLGYATDALRSMEGVRLVGTARQKAGVLSFIVDGVHPHELGTALDLEGVAIRAGHHCAQPVMARLGLQATARASFAMYNTMDEIDAFVMALEKTRSFFGGSV
jgi:cysteine desulfurase / selenocysteine lyase